ncbi:GIY-YIG nuclease family protein, partial [Desulfatirhabdium butyrativorans]|uniref:GIY-YIG nuclease family protein n=1 Tax=Desulfatirhabdium butyrativorans TaxID=340467 RepID=UPI0012EBFC09
KSTGRAFFMAFWVYVLQSQSSGRYYCGQTGDLERRLAQHNDPNNHLAQTTKRFEGPWRLIWSTQVENRSESIRLERKIKNRGISRYLKDLCGC